ncbi:MAG TPA: hypothetical protein PLM62_15145, partial [Zoogloea sp.]|nr:hypothetical protein [Zoogloea sp.]
MQVKTAAQAAVFNSAGRSHQTSAGVASVAPGLRLPSVVLAGSALLYKTPRDSIYSEDHKRASSRRSAQKVVYKPRFDTYNAVFVGRGYSSAGRALAWHARGQR